MANIAGTVFPAEIYPATPDLAALQQINDPTVMVTKLIRTGANKFEQQLVINGEKGYTVQQILALHDTLPTRQPPNGGPGTYRFEVTDNDSPAKVTWQVRLGVVVDDNQATPSNQPTQTPVQPQSPRTIYPINGQRSGTQVVPVTALAPETVVLGGGWTYNPTYQILTSPSGKIRKWNQGMALPTDDEPTFSFAGPATPVGAPGFPVPNPELEHLRRELEATKAQLSASLAQTQEEQRRREIDQMREQHRQEMLAMRTQFDEIKAALTAPPVNNELIELRRQMDEKNRIDTLRTEFMSKLESITAAVSSSGRDTNPILTLMSTLLSQQKQSETENLRIMRELAGGQLAAAQQNALTPERMLHLATELKGDNSLNEQVMRSLGMAFEQFVRMQQMAGEMGGGGGRPGVDWASLLTRLTERVGSAVQNYTQFKANAAASEVAKARAVEANTRVRGALALRQQQQHSKSQEAVPAAEIVTETSTEAARDRLAVDYFKQRKPTVDVPVEAAPAMHEAPGESEASETAPTPFEQLRAASLEDMRNVFGRESDDIFFGAPLMAFISELRADLTKQPEAHTPEEVAGYVLKARDQVLSKIHEVAQAGGDNMELPHAIEILAAGQYVYLIERLLPKAKIKYRAQTVEALEGFLIAESTSAE